MSAAEEELRHCSGANPKMLAKHPKQEPHLCPYADEILGEDSKCTCCAACQDECARDI